MSKILRHLRLRSLCSYAHAGSLQDHLVRAMLDAKARPKGGTPLATVLSMELKPVYTTGRRDRGQMTFEQRAMLAQPHPQTGERPDVVEALRGGQTTAHMPGQLVVYPILDLKAHQLSPRCYVHLLESSLIQTLATFGIMAKRTEHTGVWVTDQAKIAAVGVHLRRNISSHGIALNVCNDLSWFDRIVACGLADKQTTSMHREGCTTANPNDVATEFVKQMATLLGVQGVVEEQERL